MHMFEMLAQRMRRIYEEKSFAWFTGDNSFVVYRQLCRPQFSRRRDFSGICATHLLIPKFVLVSAVPACFAFSLTKANIFYSCLMKTCSLQGNDTTKWNRKRSQWHEKSWELRVLTACVSTLTWTHNKSFIEIFNAWKHRRQPFFSVE